jgi:hypothetical protein
MKVFLVFMICSFRFLSAAQSREYLEGRMKAFHNAMVLNEINLSSFLHDSLRYEHSNGWNQNKSSFLEDMDMKIDYHNIKEDSVTILREGDIFYARFNALIDASLDGRQTLLNLKVIEIWIKKAENWLLWVRHAQKR